MYTNASTARPGPAGDFAAHRVKAIAAADTDQMMKSLSLRLTLMSALALVGVDACGPSGSTGGTAGSGGGATAGSTGPGSAGAGDSSGAAGDAAGVGGSGDSGGSGGSSTSGAAGDASGGSDGTGTAGNSGGNGVAGSAGGGTAGAAAGRGGTTGGAAAGRGGASGAGTGGTTGGRGGAAGGSGGGAGGQTACVGSAYDPNSPPQVLTLTGSLGAHDPAALVVGNTIYLFATGLIAKTSTNLTSWQNATSPLNPRPAWVAQKVPGATNLWAPDISFFGGMYHLYYAASTFGSNASCIGHATRTDLASGSWTDQGTVICSNMGSSDNWNAIDPNIVIDDAGTPWMAFGSFWSGLKIVKMDAATGARADTTAPAGIANGANGRGSLEGAWIFKNCGYYYLFSSWGACCDGAYDYNIRVGRSTAVTGPYVDKAGLMLMGGGGGTQLVQGNSTVHAPGHNAVIVYNNKTYNLYHALNASNANAQLHIAEIAWDANGWPVSGGP
jgi:arabinan endo-1,5-alpha-L-arabinosidase